MYRIFLIFIVIISSCIPTVFLFADDCDLHSDLPTHDELVGNIERCIAARKSGNPNSITDFVCPQGDFFDKDKKPITRETLAYLIAVNTSFNKADRDIKTYMRKLMTLRESDPTVWIASIRSCTDKIQTLYDHICAFGTLESKLNQEVVYSSMNTATSNTDYIQTTHTYPQILCRDTASKKIQGWYYLQTIFMSDGISKNQKNSTDTWITEVKGAYGRVLQSLQNYRNILSRAGSKLTGLPKNSN